MVRLIKESNSMHRIELDGITIWFSYETPIAFGVDENVGDDDSPKWVRMPIVTKNIWSQTTGKHLNLVDPDKSIRINNNEFNKLLKEALQ